MSHRRPFWPAFFAVILGFGSLPAAPVTASPSIAVTVTSLEDTTTCSIMTTCTLRGAVLQNPDLIDFAVTGTIRLSDPLLIGHDVTIRGPGVESLTLDGENATGIFNVGNGRGMSLGGVTLRRARTEGNGGAIRAGLGSTVEVKESVIRDSNAGAGGAIYNDGGTVRVRDTEIRGNTASDTGGAIHNTNGGSVELIDTKLIGNSTTLANPGKGGAIFNQGGAVTVWTSVLNGNKATLGGAIFNGGNGTVTIDESTVINSRATDGGAISNGAGAVTITLSTLSDNAATGEGGAIRNAGTLVATNSTISRNSADGDGGGLYHTAGATSKLTHVTMKANRALGTGGGMYGTSVTLRNSIVVGNTGGNCNAALLEAADKGNNLSDTGACFAGGTKGDLVSNDPGVGPLALNSPGTTATHALLPNSPAIDGVTFAPTDCGATVTLDQRHVGRPQNRTAERCDIGAYELQPNEAPTISSIGNQTIDEDARTPLISFTIEDSETAAAALTVSATSSDPELVPASGIALSGTNKARTIRLTPAANRFGSTDIKVKVSDGSLQASTTFTLTVNAVDDAPVNTVPAAQSTNEDTPLRFSPSKGNAISVADVDASALRMTLSSTGGTVTLSGTAGLTVDSGANGSAVVTVTGSMGSLNAALDGLTFTPALHSTSGGGIQIVTSDLGATGSGGPLTDTDTVDISFSAVNDPPTISTIADQTTGQGTPTSAIPFTIGDAETAPGNLVVTATSNAPTIVPNTSGAIVLGGSGANRTIRLTPAPNQTGTATIDVAVSDGQLTAHETFTLTVQPANDVAAASNDSYTIAAGQTLAVSAATGVLANDGNAGSTGAEAKLVNGPAHGTVDLRPDGAFTYVARSDYAGPESFTYRATRGGSTSQVATVSITITPTACAPRATVKVTTSASNGKLQVAVDVVPLATQAPNRLVELRFGALQNGKVTLNNQPVASGATVTMPASTTTATFTVERATPGQPTTVPFTAVDECGAWPSLVGGGPEAGF